MQPTTPIRDSPIISPRSTNRRRRSTPPLWSAIRLCVPARWPSSTARPAPTRSPGCSSGSPKRSMPARSACRRACTMPRRPMRRPPRSRRWRGYCGPPARSTRRICATRRSMSSIASTRPSRWAALRRCRSSSRITRQPGWPTLAAPPRRCRKSPPRWRSSSWALTPIPTSPPRPYCAPSASTRRRRC